MGGWESPSHWVIIAILVIALFGYKKLPDAARSIGRSLRVFKTEIKGMSEDDRAREAAKDANDGKDTGRDHRVDVAGAAAVAPPVPPTPPAVAPPATNGAVEPAPAPQPESVPARRDQAAGTD